MAIRDLIERVEERDKRIADLERQLTAHQANAEELEEQLTNANTGASELGKQLTAANDYLKTLPDLEAKLAEAQADRERLDWMEETGHPYWYLEVRPDGIYLEDDAAVDFGVPTLRQAIDQARGEPNGVRKPNDDPASTL